MVMFKTRVSRLRIALKKVADVECDCAVYICEHDIAHLALERDDKDNEGVWQ